MSRRIVVVANRLPVRRTEQDWETSPGGLVAALTPIVRERKGAWVGWSGVPDFAPEPFFHDGFRNRPVPLSDEDIELFYYGFCNATLWPLYHNVVQTPQFHRHWWRPYVAVNRRFAEAAAEALEPGDVAWIQDYQLQLVPAMLRSLRPDVKIGFYLHIPFPPIELFAQLPWRAEVLDGLLGADVVAFQTRQSVGNFAFAARRFAAAEGTSRQLGYAGRQVVLQGAPIGVDAAHLDELAASVTVRNRAHQLRSRLGDGKTVFLGVDRLDYTKGIDHRLRGYETFLQRAGSRSGEHVLVQVAVPSREGIDKYVEMREHIEQLVGRINGRYGEPGYVPVHYLFRNLPAEELVAYYLVADVMCVTPLCDGMNMVAKEYVASRLDGTGALVLSEFAGAADELTRALLVNPFDLDGLAATFGRAAELPGDEQRARMAALRRQVKRHDVFEWAARCLAALDA